MDERTFLSEDFLHDFEYHSTNQYLDDEDEDEFYDDLDDENNDTKVKKSEEKFDEKEEFDEDLELQTSEIDD